MRSMIALISAEVPSVKIGIEIEESSSCRLEETCYAFLRIEDRLVSGKRIF